MVALLEASGLEPCLRGVDSPKASLSTRGSRTSVEVTRRSLCLDPSRADELASAIRELRPEEDHLGELRSSGAEMFTIWWSGHA